MSNETNSTNQPSEKKKDRTVGMVFVGAVVLLGLLYLVCCLRRVPAGYVGVIYSMNGGITGEVKGQGYHLLPPGQKMTKYSIGIEQSYLTAGKDGDSKEDDSFSAPSSDGKGLMMELTFTYRYNEEVVTDTFTRFKGRDGEELLKTFIKPNVISWTKEVTAMYPVADILGEKRAELNTILSEYLSKKFEPYGIIIEAASLINIETDDETRSSITRKVTAQQELELAKVEAETAKIQAEKDREVALIEAERNKEVALIEAERNKETAEINAEKLKIEAQGQADAKKIAADAEAEANKKIAESLTPELIEKIKYESWNGELPQVQGSGTPIIDIRE